MNKNKLAAAIVAKGLKQKDVAKLLNMAPKTFYLKMKKGANSMARRDQQIDASNFVYSIDRKIAPFLKITASKRAPHGSEFANRRKKGVRIPPVRGKQRLASMESSVNFRAEKARKRLMPLAFRQWHL